MFFKRKTIDVRMIDTSSKMALKLSALAACRYDVRRAEELYKFIASDIAALPDFTPIKPTLVEQAAQTFGKVFSWLKDNQSDIQQAWQFVTSMRNNSTAVEQDATQQQSLPPLPTQSE